MADREVGDVGAYSARVGRERRGGCQFGTHPPSWKKPVLASMVVPSLAIWPSQEGAQKPKLMPQPEAMLRGTFLV